MIPAPSLLPTDPVSRLVTRRPVYLAPDAPLLAVAEMMADESIGVVLVRGPGGPLGIVSERDLALGLAETGGVSEMEARDLMTPDVASIESTAAISDAAGMMIENEIRHLAVLSGAETVGVISIRDVLRVFVQSAPLPV